MGLTALPHIIGEGGFGGPGFDGGLEAAEEGEGGGGYV